MRIRSGDKGDLVSAVRPSVRLLQEGDAARHRVPANERDIYAVTRVWRTAAERFVSGIGGSNRAARDSYLAMRPTVTTSSLDFSENLFPNGNMPVMRVIHEI